MEWQLQLALSQERAGQHDKALANYRQLKAEATAMLARKQDNHYVETAWHSTLGMALAGLGERGAAAAQGNLAVSMVPENVDQLEWPGWVLYEARIRALNGDAAGAVPLLRHLLATPASILGRENLRIDPGFDAIRADLAFQGLLATR